MKLFRSFFPSYSDFFFQKQTPFSMKNFFYNRHDNCFALIANGRHLENLSTNRNSLNFGALADEGFIYGNLARMRLFADTNATRFNGLLRNGELLRKQSQLRVVHWIG